MSVTDAARILRRDGLARRSVQILKHGQASSGAFVASPNFPVYRYAWFRDGSFCAVALDRVGERTAAAAFHRWAARSVLAHAARIESLIAQLERGETPPADAMLPARYTLEGRREPPNGEAWPNFQLDGYGIWLWALEGHLDGRLPAYAREAASLVARYLRASWRLPCFNCWEEFDGGEHASTLGAVVAGLDAAARLLADRAYEREADLLREHLCTRFVVDGRFRRAPDDDRVDGSLLWLAVPFRVIEPTDPLAAATVAAVRDDLAPNGGVYRYRGDTYYGGGEWLLLAGSLAWNAAVGGDEAVWERAQAWVREQARGQGELPEQVSEHPQDPAMVEPWREQWGPIATPLLWSHAMYLIAEAAATTAG